MDFFSSQDQARRSTRRLVLLFTLSVFSLIVITNILVAVTLWLLDEQLAGNYLAYQQAVSNSGYQPSAGLAKYLSWQRFGLISLGVSGVIGCAMLYKWLQLAGGGKCVAERLGGKRLYPNSDLAHEQQVLNVVEEMALASGMPVPAVYLLNDEQAINAFAAGLTPADAIIGVTRGCVEQLNREQLQGVIAHEFSHILNGDMRLNIRLVAILHGILFVGLLGDILLRSSRRRGLGSRSSGNQMIILGLALLAIGWLGKFFGNLIKSAVSRQREFLADASAVQYTRNPQGIADALKIIGGYQASTILVSDHAAEMSHLFFGQALPSVKRLFATHPPLTERISRISPQWDGTYIKTELPPKSADKPVYAHPIDQITGLVAASAGSAEGINDTAVQQTSRHEVPLILSSKIHEPFTATAILYALLLSGNKPVKDKQLHYIQLTKTVGLSSQVLKLQPIINNLSTDQRLPVIKAALPALKCLSKEQYKVLCKTLLLLVRADQSFELFEWCIYQIVRHYADSEYGRVRISRPIYKTIMQVETEYQIVLSLLSHYGNTNESLQQRSFTRGANTAGFYSLTHIPDYQYTLDDFVRAVNALSLCYPLIKPRLLKGLVDCAKHDGDINAIEKEIISAIAAVMDCPMRLD